MRGKIGWVDIIIFGFLAMLVGAIASKADTHTYIQSGTLIESQTSIGTVGGTTALVYTSPTNIEFTGTSAQTCVLPSALSMPNGRRFNITNKSTGLVTVQDFGVNTLVVIPSGATYSFVLTTRVTTTGTWQFSDVPSLNSQTQVVQSFATGTTGTDFGISSSGGTHTFNMPVASASNSGKVTTTTQTFAGEKTFTGGIVAESDVSTPQDTDATSGTVVALASSGKSSIRLTAASTLAGIADGADGKIITVVNATGGYLTVTNEDLGASAVNRILTGGSNLSVANGLALIFQYDATTTRWRVTGGSPSSWADQYITLIAGDITAGYVDAAQTCLTPTMISVEGLKGKLTADYTLSVVSGVTRITFVTTTGWGAGSPGALVAGDVLEVVCPY